MIDESADDAAPSTYDPYKNAHLRGRKRFNADLADIREACSAGLVLSGLRIKSQSYKLSKMVTHSRNHQRFVLETTRDLSRSSLRKFLRNTFFQSTFSCLVRSVAFQNRPSISLFGQSDTSEYPGSHSVFGYSPDADISAKLQRIVDEIAEESPKPLGETVIEMLASVGRVVGSAAQKVAPNQQEDSSDDDEGHSGDDYDAYEDYDDIGAAPAESDSVLAKLQEYICSQLPTSVPADVFS